MYERAEGSAAAGRTAAARTLGAGVAGGPPNQQPASTLLVEVEQLGEVQHRLEDIESRLVSMLHRMTTPQPTPGNPTMEKNKQFAESARPPLVDNLRNRRLQMNELGARCQSVLELLEQVA